MQEPVIETTWFAADHCATCGREWIQGTTPVPSAYTVESIEAGDPPQPVCDHCVEEKYAALFERLLAERRSFHAT